MKLYVLTDPDYHGSPYCIRTMQGLCEAARQKRIQVVETDRVFVLPDPDDGLILIPTGFAWLEGVLEDCRALGVIPVVLNCHTPNRFTGRFCYVNADVREAIEYLAELWGKRGIRRPALYAVNSNSISDAVKIDELLAAARRYGSFTVNEEDVYYNHGSLQDCAAAFTAQLSRYDCVICTNKFAAIHLWKSLPEEARGMPFISYGSSLRIERDLPGLCSISMGYEDFGRAAISICELRRREAAIQTVGISVRCLIKEGEGEFLPIPRPSPDCTTAKPRSGPDHFYRDSDVHTMVLVENMISTCDRVDLAILSHLMDGLAYTEIAELCYLSHSALKYRVQKMRSACACSSREEFVELLRHYHAWM